MNEINWRPAIIFDYRGKALVDAQGRKVTLLTDGRGEWVIRIDEAGIRLEGNSCVDACALMNLAGVVEAE